MTKNLLTEAMRDERKAPGEYKKLAKTLKGKRDKKTIRAIIKDEKRHLKLLQKIRKERKR